MIQPDQMMQTARRAAAAALLVAALEAPGADLRDADSSPRFRLFPDPAPAAGEGAVAARKAPPEKRFWLAAGALLGLEALGWSFNRFAANESYARISWRSVRDNLQTGFSFDGDKFATNQIGHAFGGGYYFNAARSNGFTFWESGLFTAAGSALWEIAGETQGPSWNDLVNTTLGGTVTGEATYRLSQMLLDERTRGSVRVLREAAAGLLNPVQLLTRVLTGDAWAVRAERGTLEPSHFVATLDAGARHDDASGRTNPGQAFVTASIRYGDPFDRAVSRPFDSFDLDVDLSTPSTVLLTRVDVRGLLAGRELAPGSEAWRHVAGVFMGFDYTNDDTRVVSSPSFRFGLLSLRPLGGGAELRAEALGVVAPLVALGNDHLPESAGLTGRAYDYGPGAGVTAAARVRRDERDLATLAYSVFWTHTSNGIGRNATLQSFRAEGRLPVAGPFAVGGSWTWESRLTTYADFEGARAFDTVRADSIEWRAFVSWTFR
jgi:hypothetical protein